MNKVGDRKIIYSGTFIVSLGESVSFNLEIEKADNIPVTVFIKEDELEDNSAASWEIKDGELFISFYGFKNRPGIRLMQKPAKIGNFAGQDLTFSSAIERHVDAFLVNFQVMLGGKNNHG